MIESNSNNNQNVQYILNHLDDAEQEIAARTSFEYFRQQQNLPLLQTNEKNEVNSILNIRSNSKSNDDTTDKKVENLDREKYVADMVIRYLRWNDNSKERALRMIKNTIEFRKSIDIDNLRRAPTDMCSLDCQPLRSFIASKKVYVQGYDKDGRSTYLFIPRNGNGNIDEYNNPLIAKKFHIWSMERAIACSKADDKTINAIVDFNGFNVRKHAPPFELGKDLMMTLQNHYLGHLNHIYLVNTPSTFLCIWAIFKHFAGNRTASKIHFVHNKDKSKKNKNIVRYDENKKNTFYNDNRRNQNVHQHQQQQDNKSFLNKNDLLTNNNNPQLEDLYSCDQVPSWIIPKGTKNREFDSIEYLDKIPFNHAFDE